MEEAYCKQPLQLQNMAAYTPLRNGNNSIKYQNDNNINIIVIIHSMLGGIPVPTAWRVLGLRMEERPPDMEVSCEYIE
jgi:hypothetical protein